MKILIKYHDIHIKMENLGIISVSFSFQIDTREELSKCLYQMLDQHKLYGNRTLYLDTLHIEGPYKSRYHPNQKYPPNHIIQCQFNEVIQSLIDVKEHSRICAYNVNNIILSVKFNDSKDRSSTKLVGKLIQVYNTLQNIKISLYTVIALSDIQELLADRDRSFCAWNEQIIYSTKKEMKPNIVLPLNCADINTSSETSQYNDEVTEEELKITKYRTVEDEVVEEVVEPMDLTLPRYNDDNCDTI